MPFSPNFDEELQTVDTFWRFGGSRGIFTADKAPVNSPSLLEASTNDEADLRASPKGTNRALAMFESKCLRCMNGLQLLDDALKNKRFLPTGCGGIDILLGGGLREGQLTEIAGPSSSGKTQICLYIASHVAFRLCGSIVFLDSSNSFSPTRIASIVNQICRPADKEVHDRRIKMIMSCIHCQSVFDIFSLRDALHELESTLNKQTIYNGGKICMLIIDSISSLITPILGGKDSQGRSLMVSLGYLMKQLADEWNISVLVTNHMVSGGGGTSKPAMGESWKCIPHVKLQLSRCPGSTICNISVLKHTSMPCGRSAEFVIPN
ncbi:DNA repair protein RAD51 homolog 4 isoform X2 [Phalaenopsis equestris]|uniref:DNA repair protein RAD51 homolog 4 isoform X2 n=1 Tax=Phalaenopsis equestris TaxID=78828 RepID=UPI0009E1E1DE|nr:DNA repair protein RAD51 homolog 4 isoform X2 [Phalaenopsis equestris]